MAYEQKELQCTLFKNEKKDEKHPTWGDLQGHILIDGKEYYVDAWGKKTKKGEKCLSIKLRQKEQRQQESRPAARQNTQQNPQPQPQQRNEPEPVDDDFPF